MAEEDEGAAVAIIFFDVVQEDNGDVRAQGTAINWATTDMGVARTLKEQLNGLLGDPISESVMPWIARDVLEKLENPWPGAVKFDQADDGDS